MRHVYRVIAFGGCLGMLAVQPATVFAQEPQTGAQREQAKAELFRRLVGQWSCEGGFARGGALSADLSFASAIDDRVLTFTHMDRPPNVFWQRSTWLMNGKTGRLVSVGANGSQKERTAAPVMFTASEWTDRSVIFVADTLNVPPFVPNRFVYSLPDSNHLRMRWEINRDTLWTLGDSLTCRRATRRTSLLPAHNRVGMPGTRHGDR